MKRNPFERLVHEVVQDYMRMTRFHPHEIDDLRASAEDYLTKIFEDAKLLAIHTKRVTMFPSDTQLL